MNDLTLSGLKRRYFAITSLFWFATVLPAATVVLFAQARGLDLFEVGFVFGAYGLTIVLLEVPTGGLADAVGRRRVTLVAVGVTLLSQLVLVFASSFPLFLLYAVVSGAGRALVSGAPEAWFIDGLKSLDEDIDIQPPLAQAEVFATALVAVGTLLGGFLPDWFAFLPPTETSLVGPLSVPILASALGFAALGVVVLAFMREARPAGDAADTGDVAGFARLPELLREAFRLSVTSPVILLLLLATVVSGAVLSGLETFWQPFFNGFLGEREGNTYLFGVILAGSFGLLSLGSLASIPLSRVLNKRYALVAALAEVGQLVFIVALALQTNALVAAPLFWFVYLSRGVGSSPQATMLNNEVPSGKRSAMLSIRSLALALGGFLGSVGLGYLADTFSIRVAWLVLAGVLVLAVAIYLRLHTLLRTPP